jgi:Tellurite resistance protein TehB
LRALSLKHEYEVYVEREIENYKDSLPRHALLSIGDEAVAAMRQQSQFVLTELVLWEEVDRIIMRRLRIPTYPTWRRRCFRTLEQYRQPEHWGLRPESALVRSIQPEGEAHVLVTGGAAERAALYLAARGYDVTAVEQSTDVLDRVMIAAGAAGLTQRVRGCATDISHWTPDGPLHAVVCTPAAFAGLTPSERKQVIELLQQATTDGGVHLVETIVAGQEAMSVAELRDRYAGWEISIERDGTQSRSFLARKGVA